jgi:hypothetical protein
MPALDPSQKPQDFTTGRARQMLFSAVMISAGASRRRTARSLVCFRRRFWSPAAIRGIGPNTDSEMRDHGRGWRGVHRQDDSPLAQDDNRFCHFAPIVA